MAQGEPGRLKLGPDPRDSEEKHFTSPGVPDGCGRVKEGINGDSEEVMGHRCLELKKGRGGERGRECQGGGCTFPSSVHSYNLGMGFVTIRHIQVPPCILPHPKAEGFSGSLIHRNVKMS